MRSILRRLGSFELSADDMARYLRRLANLVRLRKIMVQDGFYAELKRYGLSKADVQRDAFYRDGLKEGIDIGIKEGKDLGIKEGIDIGIKEGKDLGIKEGIDIGIKEGKDLGIKEGIDIGIKEGKDLGIKEGIDIGIKEGKDLGIKEGIDIGIKEGKDLGIKEGIDIGIKEGKSLVLATAVNMLKNLGIDPETAAQTAQIPVETLINALQSHEDK